MNNAEDEIMAVDTEMKDGQEEVVEKIEKKEDEMTLLKTLMKAVGYLAYLMLQVLN